MAYSDSYLISISTIDRLLVITSFIMRVCGILIEKSESVCEESII